MSVIIQKTLIDVPVASCHASTFAFVGDDVLLCFFGGTAEGAGDVGIYGTRSTGRGFSPAVLLAAEEGVPHWNPVLHAQGRHVTLYYKAGAPIPRWHTRVMTSEDGGETFGPPAVLVPGDIGGRGPVRNKPVVLADGTLIAPASVETESRWDAFVDISHDGGRTFTASPFVPLWRTGERKPAGGKKEPCPVSGKGVIQPTLWQSADGALHMLLRSTEGLVLRSDSQDGGHTFCPAYATNIPNNNSGIDLDRAEECIVLALNPVPGNWAARTPLCLWQSEDEGETFSPLCTIEDAPGEYSYPCVRIRGDEVYLSYTWNRRKIAFCRISL